MNGVVYGLLAGILASLLCFWINNLLLKVAGDNAILLQIPIIEETAKTMGSVALEGNLVLCHMVFGTVEALYDLYNSPREYSLTASLLSLTSHTVFGIVSFIIIVYLGGHYLIAVFFTAVIHSLWNRFITGYAG